MIDYETFCKIHDCHDRQRLTITQTARRWALNAGPANRSQLLQITPDFVHAATCTMSCKHCLTPHEAHVRAVFFISSCLGHEVNEGISANAMHHISAVMIAGYQNNIGMTDLLCQKTPAPDQGSRRSRRVDQITSIGHAPAEIQLPQTTAQFMVSERTTEHAKLSPQVPCPRTPY